jgi:hypothetical protein
MSELNLCLIDGYESPLYVIGVKSDDEAIMFYCRGGSGSLLTKELVTDNGQTIGERNRAQLHSIFDEWLDKTIEGQNETIN